MSATEGRSEREREMRADLARHFITACFTSCPGLLTVQVPACRCLTRTVRTSPTCPHSLQQGIRGSRLIPTVSPSVPVLLVFTFFPLLISPFRSLAPLLSSPLLVSVLSHHYLFSRFLSDLISDLLHVSPPFLHLLVNC